MAVSSSRSPSPSPVAGRSNPNPRNSEINNNVRRSFSGNSFSRPSIVANLKGFNPVTPANSPSGFPRRHSTGKEGGVPPHHSEKENEKDLTAKPVRIRSPALSKGTKNFMSPTVSAASKITASPRKKVLVERNEIVRSSVSSSSDGKSILSSLNLQEVVEDLNSMPASSDSTVVDHDQREVSSSPSKAYKAEEVLDSQVPKFMNDSEFLSETTADQSLPPYDPKTNYLSPRPLFLHYKPNLRIEQIRSRECNRLEDCFASESLSDNETTQETESEISSVELMMEKQNAEVEDSEAEVEESKAALEESEAALEETVEVEPNVSEPRTIEAKVVGQSHSFFTSKPIPLLLFVLLVGCLWIPLADSPLIGSVIESSVGRESSFTKLYEPTELAGFARTNFDLLRRNFWRWSTNAVSYFSKMIPTAKESNKLNFLRSGNFTEQNLPFPMKGMQIGIVHLKEQGSMVYEKGGASSQVHPEFEDAKLIQEAIEPDLESLTNSELEQIQEYHAASYTDLEQASQGKPEGEESNLSLQDEVAGPHTTSEVQTEEESKLISREAHGILAEKEQEDSHVSGFEPEAEVVASRIDHEAQSIVSEKEMEAQVPQASEIKPELPQAEKFLGENQPISNAEVESNVAVSEPESLESEALTEENSQSFKELYQSLKENPFAVNVLGISLLIPILTVAAAFKFAKQQKSPTPSATAIPMDQLLAKKLAEPAVSVENTHQERLSSRNWPTEVDMVDEPCPSEMSSFQRTTSFSKKESKGASEAQSRERGLRKSNKRESLASSSEYSMGSPSYGSFTSYEKIHSKQGCGDQEVVTPVRRSSRIRNQVVTSS